MFYHSFVYYYFIFLLLQIGNKRNDVDASFDQSLSKDTQGNAMQRSNVFLGKGVGKICRKVTG